MNEPAAFAACRPFYYLICSAELVYLIIALLNVFILGQSMLYIISFFDTVEIPYIATPQLQIGQTPIPTPIPRPYGDDDAKKLKQIKKNFRTIYFEYLKKAELHDYLLGDFPYQSDFYNLSLTLLESLPTLAIMGFTKEINRRIKKLNFSQIYMPKTFSRSDFVGQVISPLISLYDLTSATESTSLLSKIFKTFSYLPKNFDVSDKMVADFQGISAFSDDPYLESHLIGSIQLEYLGFHKFFRDHQIYDCMLSPFITFFGGKTKGLICDLALIKDKKLFEDSFSLSQYGRSYLDYFIKTDIITNHSSPQLNARFGHYYDEMKNLSLIHDGFFLRMRNGTIIDEVLMDEAFIPAAEMLHSEKNRKRADEILNSYLSIRKTNKFGLFPRSVSVKNGMKILDGTVVFPTRLFESLFILYRKTHDKKYRDIAWDIHTNYTKQFYTATGFTNLKLSEDGNNIMKEGGVVDPKILGAYYTYLYLLFSDSTELPLEDWTFTWNGHPLRNVRSIRYFDFRLTPRDDFFFLR